MLMAKLTKYGFIFKGQGYKDSGEFNHINSDFFKATIVAVPSVESACIAAKKLIKEGVEIIELCGGFDNNDLDTINKYTDDLVPIGLVSFDEKQNRKLMSFLEK